MANKYNKPSSSMLLFIITPPSSFNFLPPAVVYLPNVAKKAKIRNFECYICAQYFVLQANIPIDSMKQSLGKSWSMFLTSEWSA